MDQQQQKHLNKERNTENIKRYTMIDNTLPNLEYAHASNWVHDTVFSVDLPKNLNVARAQAQLPLQLTPPLTPSEKQNKIECQFIPCKEFIKGNIQNVDR